MKRVEQIDYHSGMQRFKLPKPICAVVIQDGKRIAKSLSAGSFVMLVPDHVTVQGLVDVVCDGELHSVFEQDLRDLATPLLRTPRALRY